MNNFSFSFILFILVISTPHIIAQHKDCVTAIELCGSSPFYIAPGIGIGLTDAGLGNTCLESEYNSMWVKWMVMESGIVTFVLTPDSLEQDLDFIVFHAEGDYDCSKKTQIRCMAAGANIGQPPHEWSHCAGSTGLAFGETDVEEPAGCLTSNNNYLAPIEALAGDQFIILINDFSGGGNGYTLREPRTTSICEQIL